MGAFSKIVRNHRSKEMMDVWRSLVSHLHSRIQVEFQQLFGPGVCKVGSVG